MGVQARLVLAVVRSKLHELCKTLHSHVAKLRGYNRPILAPYTYIVRCRVHLFSSRLRMPLDFHSKADIRLLYFSWRKTSFQSVTVEIRRQVLSRIIVNRAVGDGERNPSSKPA